MLRFTRRQFWIGLAVVIVLAALPRLFSYRFSLPYIDHPDEPNKYLAAQEWRGLYEHHKEGYYDGYPPAYIALSAGVQLLAEPLGVQGSGATVGVMRFLSVLANLGTLIFIALAARRAAGDLAGWAAGLLWGVSPLVLRVGVYAIQDPFVYLFTALALWLAAEAATGEQRRGWAVWSVAAALGASLFKYTALPAIAPGVLVSLAALRENRGKALRDLALEALLIVPFTLWAYRQIQLMSGWQRHASDGLTGGVAGVLDPARVLNNVYHAFVPLNPIPALALLAVGIVAYVVARRRDLPTARWEPLALAAVVLIVIPWSAASFSKIEPNRIKDAIPATAAACVLLGAALAQLYAVTPARWPAAARLIAPLLALAVVIGPQVPQDAALVAQRRLPDSRVAMRGWVEQNLEPAPVIVTYENEKTFNPFWGGIPSAVWFDWLRDDAFEQTPVEVWRFERGAQYAVIPLWKIADISRTDEGQAFLGELLPLRTFALPGSGRGPEMTVFRLWPPENGAGATFGDAIHLIGYDLDRTAAAPGDAVTLRFYWQAAAPPPENYSVFVHLMPLDEVRVITQADGNPAVAGRLTQTWDDPTETLISPPFTLALPPDLPAGEYRVMIGLYNFETGVRLPVTDASGDPVGDSLELVRLTVTP